MLFDDLPPGVQELVRDYVAGEVHYRPPLVMDWQPYWRFQQVPFRGLLTAAEVIQPESHLSTIGFGKGFAALQDKFVVRDATQPSRRTRGSYPLDRDLEFHDLNGPGSFVVSKRVRDILAQEGCIADHMSRDVYQQPGDHIEATDWALVDFPCAPIVDYERSQANWRIYTFTHVDAKPGDPPETIYIPDLLTGYVQIAVQRDSQLGEIVRDVQSPQYVFLSRRIRMLLRGAGVKGPDYDWIAGPWMMDSPPPEPKSGLSPDMVRREKSEA